MEAITSKCTDGRGRGLCKRIISVVKAARVLDTSFYEAFGKKPVELLQLLCLKAQDSFEEAKQFVETHFMSPASIAQILAESFLKVGCALSWKRKLLNAKDTGYFTIVFLQEWAD